MRRGGRSGRVGTVWRALAGFGGFGRGRGGGGEGAAFVFEVALAVLIGAFGGIGAVGSVGLGECGFVGGVLFQALLVVGAELDELADERLGAGEEAAVVVPQAGERGGAVLEEVVGGEGDSRIRGGVLSAEC